MSDTLRLNPVRTALINVDMQRCFVENSPLAAPDGPALLQRVNRLIDACRRSGALVVHTRGWMRADGSDVGSAMADLVPPFIISLYTEGADSAQLHDDLNVAPEDLVIDKSRYGAFHGTDLTSTLRTRGIDTVLITGIATNICCETTAREAAQRDFRVLFMRDGTATKEMNGVSAEALQSATCASLGMVFAHISSIDEASAALLTSQQHAVTA